MCLHKLRREQCPAADRDIRNVQLALRRNMAYVVQHVRTAGAERKQHDHAVPVGRARLPKGKHPPPAEALPPHKAIAGEHVRHGNPVLRTDIQHLIRSVSHAPKQYGAPCLTLQVPPQVGRARIR